MAQLERLRYFVAVAEERHFGRAAERLRIAQPSLSQQIKRLEQEVGARLLDRSARGLRLTPAGETLLERVSPALVAVDDAVAAARAVGERQPERINVGYLPGAVGLLMGDVVRALANDHPDAVVRLHQYDYGDPSAGLRSGATDLAFVRMPIDMSGLRFTKLGCEPRVLAVPTDHRLATRPMIDLADAFDEPWIVMPQVDTAWSDFYLAADRRERPALLGPEANSTDAAFEAVIAGQGVMLTEPSIAARYLAQGVRTVKVCDLPPSLGGVAWRVGHETSAVRCMVSVAAKLAPLRCAEQSERDPQATTTAAATTAAATTAASAAKRPRTRRERLQPQA